MSSTTEKTKTAKTGKKNINKYTTTPEVARVRFRSVRYAYGTLGRNNPAFPVPVFPGVLQPPRTPGPRPAARAAGPEESPPAQMADAPSHNRGRVEMARKHKSDIPPAGRCPAAMAGRDGSLTMTRAERWGRGIPAGVDDAANRHAEGRVSMNIQPDGPAGSARGYMGAAAARDGRGVEQRLTTDPHSGRGGSGLHWATIGLR